MGQQIHIAVADLLRTCECSIEVNTFADPLNESNSEAFVREFRLIAENADLGTRIFQLTASDTELLSMLVHGGAECWADCNYWSHGPDLLAWANQLGVAFRVH